MANVFIEEQVMTNIGNAIRTKNGTSAKILPADMPSQILAIDTGSEIDMSDATVTPETLGSGIIAYGVGGQRVEGIASFAMFTWEKYSVVDGTLSSAYSQQEVTNKIGSKLSSTQITLYSSMSFNENTGVFTLSNGATNVWGTIYNNKTYQNYPYYYVDDAHTKVAEIVSMTPPKTGSIVQNYSVNYT